MKHPAPADLDELDQTVRSPGFALLRAHQEQIVVSLVRELKQDIPAEKTWRLRGEIAGVERCLRLPADLKRDLQSALANQKEPT